MTGQIIWVLVYVLCILLALTFALASVYTCYVFYVHRKYAHLPGPPLSNFYLGNVPQIREVTKKNIYRTRLFLEWAEKYGPVYRIFLFHQCLVVPTSRAMVKEFLTKSKYPKAQLFYRRLYSVVGERFFGRGLVTDMDHQRWKRRRDVLNPAFHKKNLRIRMEQFNQVADGWIEKLTTVADGKTTINMVDYMCRVTLEMVAKIAFNMELDAVHDADSAFVSAFSNILEGLSAQIEDPLLKMKWSQRPFVKRVRESVVLVRNQVRKVLEERRQAIADGQYVPNDILTLLLQCLEQNDELTMEDVMDDFNTMLLAGQETTASLLSFLLREVGRKPEVYQRLQNEVDEVVGDKISVTFDDLGRLDYMSNVMTETLRMYPPGSGTSRENTADIQIEGHHIPKDSIVLLSFFVIHRLTRYFPEPEEFNPDRWAADKDRLLFTYMPFSLGQRSCLGKHFAQVEAKVLLSKFLQRFTYTLDPNQSFDIHETTTLRPKGGVNITLKSR